MGRIKENKRSRRKPIKTRKFREESKRSRENQERNQEKLSTTKGIRKKIQEEIKKKSRCFS
jgi:hypothetical protein